MKLLFLIFVATICIASATSPPHNELPTKTDGVLSPPKEQSSSSESSEEKVATTVVTGTPVVALAEAGGRMKRDEADEHVGDGDYPVTEPPKAAVTPQGVEEDDGLPDLGLGSRKRRDLVVSRARRYA